MNADWMLEVLSDLKTFSRQNDLLGLAEQLDDTLLVAAQEIGRAHRGETAKGGCNGGKTGVAHQRPGRSDLPQ